MPDYDRAGKACIKNYNLKTLYSSRMKPFFKKATGQELDETEEIKRLNLNGPRKPVSLEKEPEVPAGKGGKKDDKKGAGGKNSKLEKDAPSGLENDATPASPDLSAIDKDKEKEVKYKPASYRFNLATSLPPRDADDEDLDMWAEMRQEHLPGNTKTKWALSYKNNTDQAIEASLDVETSTVSKRRTKGLFPVETRTNAGNWLVDKEW